MPLGFYVVAVLEQYGRSESHRREIGKLDTVERWQRAAALVGWYAGLFEISEYDACDLAETELKESAGTIRRQAGARANRKAFEHWRELGGKARSQWRKLGPKWRNRLAAYKETLQP